MTDYDNAVANVAGQLMNGLIARGVVKAGSEIEYYNIWCIKKARRMVDETWAYIHKGTVK